MKQKLLLFTLAFLFAITFSFGQCLTDDFNSGYGNWSESGTYQDTTAGLTGNGTGFNTNGDEIITSALLTNPQTMTFWLARSNNSQNKTLSVQYSTSNTGPWTSVRDILVGEVTTTHQEFTINLSLTGGYYLRIAMTQRSGGSYYLDDVEVICTTTIPCATPTAQATSLDLTSNITSTSIDGTFTAASPAADGYLVVQSTSSSLASNPVDTTDYASGDSLGGGTVVQAGSGTSFTASGLTPGTLYYFFAFSYNDTGCSGGPLYYTTSPLSDSETTLSLPCLIDDFNSGYGNWSDSGTYQNTTPGLTGNGTGFNSTSDLITTTSTLTNPQIMRFWLARSASTAIKTLSVQYSTSNTGPWTSARDILVGEVIETHQEFTINLNLTGDYYFRIEMTQRSGGSYYLDDIEVDCGTSCSHTISSLSPSSGPVGTTVTVTGTGFTASSTATIDAISATVNFISTTELEVTIPSGATTADLEITEAACVVGSAFTVFTEDTTTCDGTYDVPADWTELMFAGIFDETSGSCHYIELFNPTSSDIDLSTYGIGFDQNDASATSIPGGTYSGGTRALSGTIEANSTYMILVTSESSDCASCTSLDVDLEFLSTSLGYNGFSPDGYDKLVLIENFGTTNTEIDMWSNGDTHNDGYIYTRSPTATAPTMTYSTADWSSSTTPDCFGFALEITSIAPYILGQSYDPPSCSTDAILSVTGFEAYDLTGDTKELAFQWYEVAPGATTWTVLSDGGVFSGSTTDTLTISNTAALDGYQYYCQVREDLSDCYKASDAIKIDTTGNTTTWEPGTGWSNGSPTSDTIVTLNSDYITSVNGNFSCCSLTLSDNVQLDINEPDNYVSIENDLTINDGAILNVENNSSLVMVYDDGDVTLIGSGIANVNKQSTPYELYDYTYWSSPMVNETIGDALAGSYIDYIFYYNGANYYDALDGNGDPNPDGFDDNGDDWVQVGASDVMSPGKGYAAMGSITETYSHTQNATFSGEVNNGIITEAVVTNSSPSAPGFDYNLVGNPYPSAIDADQFILQNPAISGTLYFWTHIDDISASYPGPDAQNFHPDDYASYNLSGGVATMTGSTSDAGASNAPTGKIGSGQGFIVEANYSGDVTFNNSMRNVANSNSQFFRSSSASTIATPVKDRMWINLTNPDGAFNQALIGFFDNATHGYDNYYDGVFLGGGTHVSLYSLIDGNAFNIQGKPSFKDTYIVPLGFDSRILVPLTISIFETEGILSDIPVYLIDNELDVVHNLKDSDYVFEIAAIGTYNERFEIVFKEPEALSVDEVEVNTTDLIIANQSENILVKYISDTGNTLSQVKAYDVLGRLLIDTSTTENELLITSNTIKVGTVLFFNVQLSNGEILKQKFIKL